MHPYYYYHYNPYFDPNFNPYLRAYIIALHTPPPAPEPQAWSIWTFNALDYHLLCGRQRAPRPETDVMEADLLLTECCQ